MSNSAAKPLLSDEAVLQKAEKFRASLATASGILAALRVAPARNVPCASFLAGAKYARDFYEGKLQSLRAMRARAEKLMETFGLPGEDDDSADEMLVEFILHGDGIPAQKGGEGK